MPSCSSCGSPIPEGQGNSCSMCYGDPDYGRDFYYRDWLNQQEEQDNEQQEEQHEEETTEDT